jgi:hypothetical protein
MNNAAPSKMIQILKKLGLKENEESHLCDLIAETLQSSKCSGIQLNSISNSIVIDIVFEMTNIRLSSSNLCSYKSLELVKCVASRLNIILDNRARCHVNSVGGTIILTSAPDGPIEAFHNAINNSSPENFADLYKIWRNNDVDVGDKRNWPSKELIQWCQNKNITPSIPISFDLPTRISIVFKALKPLIIEFENEKSFTLKLDESVNEKIRLLTDPYYSLFAKSTKKWLNDHCSLPTIKYVDTVEARDRCSPYVYCRDLNGQCKVGKAENSLRFKKDDRGIVICLKNSHSGVAAEVEEIILNGLNKLKIFPVENSQERFNASLQSLCSLIIEICAKSLSVSIHVRSILATHNY